jgi:hypothetical protein
MVDSLFYKLGEPRSGNARSISIQAAKNKLAQLEIFALEENTAHHPDAAENVFNYSATKRALQQLLSYFEDTSTPVTEEDHVIYYTFAHDALQKAHSIRETEGI